MPIPQPGPDEGRDDFIARCMANPTMREDFSNVGQRAAVCFEKWKEEREEYSSDQDSSDST
jgi:hypothetical protein